MEKLTFQSIYQDSVYDIGIGKNQEGQDLLLVRVKPEGIAWHYNLIKDFDLRLAQLDPPTGRD